MPKQRDPLVPKSEDDPAGAGRLVSRALAEVDLRYASLERDIIKRWRSVDYLVINEVAEKVAYQLTTLQLQELVSFIADTVDRWINSGREYGPGMWFDGHVAGAYEKGTRVEVANLAWQSEVYAAARPFEAVVSSEAWLNRVAAAQIASRSHWTGQSATTKTKITDAVMRAVADGISPKQATQAIKQATGVSLSEARRIAQTDILGALRQAKMDEQEAARIEIGLQTGLLWSSALMAGKTRPWHASRHGKTYTRAQVTQFYAERGNKFNCYCAVTAVVLDDKGKPILADKLKNFMAERRESFLETVE